MYIVRFQKTYQKCVFLFYEKINQDEEVKYDQISNSDLKYTEICVSDGEFINKCLVYYEVDTKIDEMEIKGICAVKFYTNLRNEMTIGNLKSKDDSSDVWINTQVIKPPFISWPSLYVLVGFKVDCHTMMNGLSFKFVPKAV